MMAAEGQQELGAAAVAELGGLPEANEQLARRTRIRRKLQRLVRHRAGLIGLILVLTVVLTGIFAPWLAPYTGDAGSISARLLPPDWSLAADKHFLGTDNLGRDMLSRIILGSRMTLLIGLISVVVSGVAGTVAGLVSGFYGGWVDTVIMRFVDMQMVIPSLVIGIAVVAVIGSGLKSVLIVLPIAGWVIYARLVRAQVLTVREEDYVLAARAVGATDSHIMFRHILPNVLTPAIVTASFAFAQMVILESSLSFLGLGVDTSTVTWGSMLNDGRPYIQVAWWAMTFPGLALLITLTGINLVGDWLRDLLDPRLRRLGSSL